MEHEQNELKCDNKSQFAGETTSCHDISLSSDDEEGDVETNGDYRVYPEHEPNSVANFELNSVVNAEPNSVVNSEPNSVVNSEPNSVVNAEPNSVVNAEPNSVANVEPNSVVNSEQNRVVNSELNSMVNSEQNSVVNAEWKSAASSELQSSMKATESQQQNGDTLQLELLSSCEEIDADSSLYVVSDLEDCDSNSDISFTDVPTLLTMDDDEPSSRGNLLRFVSQTSEHTRKDTDIPQSPSEQVSNSPGAMPPRPTVNAEPCTPVVMTNSFSESVTWNGHHDDTTDAIQTPPSREQEIETLDSQAGKAAMISNLNESLTISESNDSVLDTSTDGEGSTSSHKEIFIDYRRSLVRKDSTTSDDRLGSDNVSASSFAGSYDSGLPTRDATTPLSKYLVVAAIDFGTTYSGYAFAFTRDPGSIHMMRRWEGGDPGVSNQKTPTTLLLTPDRQFHSFGFGARDFYHDLESSEAKKYMYFEKFKMKLYSCEELTEQTEIRAANGKPMKAIDVFSYSLRFFKQHVLEELSDQMSTGLAENDICWVITVPAIWKAGAKQFMRKAAYNAALTDYENPERVIIALEPEAASIFCRKLRMRDCILDEVKKKSVVGPMMDWQIESEFEGKTKYMVVDCGGGTVDLTVHELDNDTGILKELHKGVGGPCGATGVDIAFEALLKKIFGRSFMEQFKFKRPAGWVDLMIAYEAKKRNCSPARNNWLNLALPFSFIDYYKKHHKTSSLESAVKKHGDANVKWSNQGMLRLAPQVMNDLFQPVLKSIVKHVEDLLNSPNVNGVNFLFLVGGFGESPLVQHAIRDAFASTMRVVIPQDVSLTILKGAVLFGLDPTVIRVRRSALTYGVGVLNKFIPGKHPREKIVRKNGVMWCTDIFDKFVVVDQAITLGDKVTRSYAPAKVGQTCTTLNVYCTDEKDVEYITDPSVRRCGNLRIEMPEVEGADTSKPRELQATMTFWDTEIKVSGMDVRTGKEARARIDFLSN